MEIKVPEVGESVREATIAKWQSKMAMRVEKNDLLCELETDKINLELNAEADGNTTITPRRGDGEDRRGHRPDRRRRGGQQQRQAPAESEKKKTKAPKKKPEKKAPTEQTRDRRNRPEKKRRPQPPAARSPLSRTKTASPHAAAPPPAKIADERRGTRAADERHAPAHRRAPGGGAAADGHAHHLQRSRHEPHSRTAAQAARRRFEKRHGVRLGLMSFFVKACVEALKEFPEVNARIDGNDIVYQHFYDIGIAVGTERGLVVPVLRDADRLHFAEIEKTDPRVRRQGREQQARPSPISKAEPSPSATAASTARSSRTPILNPPQSGVLGMHAIQERPVVRDGEIVIRPMMNLALSYDHRLIDGREAVQLPQADQRVHRGSGGDAAGDVGFGRFAEHKNDRITGDQESRGLVGRPCEGP